MLVFSPWPQIRASFRLQATIISILLLAAPPAADTLSAQSVDAEDTATSIDLGGFVGIADNAPIRSIFDLISVGTLISGAQSDAADENNRVIARDTPLPVGSRTDASDFNLRSFAYRHPFLKIWAVTIKAENNVYGQQTYLYSPLYETYGIDNARPDRTDARVTLSRGKLIRLFAGLSYNTMTSPLGRSQIGNGGFREGRGRFRQELAGGEVGIGYYPEFLGGLLQAYGKASVGSGLGTTRFRLVTYGNARDPRTAEQKLTDDRVFLETDYLEIVDGKVRLRSLYTIGEVGGLVRLGKRFAVRMGIFLQAYTYTIPGTEGNMIFRPNSGEAAVTPLQLVPSNILRNIDTVRGVSFSFLVKL